MLFCLHRTCRKLQLLMFILITLVIILLYLNFKSIYGKIHVVDESVTIATCNLTITTQVSGIVNKLQVSHQLTICVTLNLQVYMLEVEKCDELFKSVVLKVCKLKPICLILIWTVY